MVQRIDLMAQLMRHPQATYWLRVRGESMRNAGIFDRDVVMFDRAITPRSGQVVVPSNNDGCTIARSNEAKALGDMAAARYCWAVLGWPAIHGGGASHNPNHLKKNNLTGK